MKKVSDTLEAKKVRIGFVFILMILALVGLIAKLWTFQVRRGEDFKSDLYAQSIRRVRLPGTRGRVLDRNGKCLAENRPSYCIAIYLEELRQIRRLQGKSMADRVEYTLERLSHLLGLEVELTREQIEMHIKRSSPMPLLAWRDVGEETVARLAESSERIAGTDIYPEPVRMYPYGTLACHVVGYVGRADPVLHEGEIPYHYYLPDMKGKQGVERTHDYYLRGKAGGRLIRVDVMGFKHDLPGHREVEREPEVGQDVKLTIDLRIQQLAESALGNDSGGVVVMDPRDGTVLAMASRPAYDPNVFIPSISVAEWKKLNNPKTSPLLNRAVAGSYPPGSTFKVVVAMAALENLDNVSGSTSFQCPGFYALGRTELKCWNWKYGGHGLLDMRKALEQSCNTYFCHLGYKCKYSGIQDMAEQLGFGRKTGITVDYERPGLLPDPSWIQSKGDLANVSIGQGALEATPMQMAVVVSAIANNGIIYRPRIVLGTRDSDTGTFHEFEPELVRNLGWSQSSLAVVRGGMHDVVNARTGTGKRARVPSIKVAGKTGTAEYGPRDARKKRGWMIAFAPYEDPQYAVAMVVDDATSGGITVAPKIKMLLAGIFRVEI